MKKKYLFIFCIVFFISHSSSFAQSTINISKPRLELQDNNISILYDILNSSSTDTFNISLEIRDSIGTQIKAYTLRGDIGGNVCGGSNKQINWDLSADSIYLDAMIYVKVNAELIAQVVPEETVIPLSANTSDKNKDATALSNSTEPVDAATSNKSLKRGSVIFSSLLFPGTGLTKINKGDPHWLKGVAAYGCLGTSALFYMSSKKSHKDYLLSVVPDNRDEYLIEANKKVTLSNTFLISAISIWTIDFIWTLAGSKELKNAIPKNWTAFLSLDTSSGNEVIAPVLSLKYNF